MKNVCIQPGLWEIETFTVRRSITGRWVIYDGGRPDKPLTTVRTFAEAREWIAADLDKIDLGMTRPREET
jgi:hypothetical protein